MDIFFTAANTEETLIDIINFHLQEQHFLIYCSRLVHNHGVICS
jgi:hypothetical protein